MTLLTLFSAPKPFTDPHIAMIQRNAIRSWTLLPDVEIILLGAEEGLAQAAKEFGVKHLPDVERNESGTPLISSMFQLAQENSHSDLLCIINTDMILVSDFLEAANFVGLAIIITLVVFAFYSDFQRIGLFTSIQKFLKL